MPNYRRRFTPGGTVFLTLVTADRGPVLRGEGRVALLRRALRRVRAERPFRTVAAVVLPDHIHLLWSLPGGDADYSTRVGRIKVEFVRLLADASDEPRRPIRTSAIWQRRFWEHTIANGRDLETHLDYIHYNPVKHGHVACPHAWPFSSFHRWVGRGLYDAGWGCRCIPGGMGPICRPRDRRRYGE